jgi:hypothetical protein
MRKLGYILLVVGFLAVMEQAVSHIARAMWVTRAQLRALPQQDAFTRKEVEDVISKTALAGTPTGVIAVLPGFLMLCGGILLSRTTVYQKKGDNVA